GECRWGFRVLGSDRQRREYQKGNGHAETRRGGENHGCTTGRPRWTTSCLAVSIGRRTMPFCLSTQPGVFRSLFSAARISAMSVTGVFVLGGRSWPVTSLFGKGCRRGVGGTLLGRAII